MILDKIIEATKVRIEKKLTNYEEIKRLALSIEKNNPFSFEKALKTQEFSFICEVKKASPSKGIIADDFPYVNIAKEYEAGGAAAVSVLTEPDFFMGEDEYLTEIKRNIHIPVLRKDFNISELQIYEAKTIGADAILLICAILDTKTIAKYIGIADSLGLSCLVEAHDEREIESAIHAGTRIIGVNNRNLKTFEVDINNSVNLRKLVPQGITFISESGIKTAADVEVLIKNNVNGALVGETLMKSENKAEEIAKLRGKSYDEN